MDQVSSTQAAATRWRRAIPALAGLVAFVAMAALYAGGHVALYSRIAMLWGLLPGDVPFMDFAGVLSGIECKRQGIDPYVHNPCDPWTRQFDYPPTWLWLSFLPVTGKWLVPAGFALCLAFFASLLLLPPARTTRGARLVAAGVLSSVTLFAVERANNDLAVFILVAAGAALLGRARAGVAGYALIQAAAFLKYFPLAAMALALFERPRRFFAVAAASLAATVLFVATQWHELASALGTIPFAPPFGLVYGATNLASGLILLGLAPALAHAVTVLLVVGSLVAGVRLGLGRCAREAAMVLTKPERTFFVAGAALVLGSFYTAQNIDYRAVNLLLMLPALVALGDARAPRRYASLFWVALAILWMNFFRIKLVAVAALFSGTTQVLIAALPGFLLREVLWWWLIVHTMALVVALLRDASVVEWALNPRRHAATG